MEELLTVEELAEILKIKPEIVRRKVRSGHIKAYKIGKSWRFSREAVKNFLDKCLQ